MENYNIDEVKKCYELAAEEYFDMFSNELEGKPFDRNILERFSKELNSSGKILDVGTGVGHIGNYLYKQGLKNITGIDISSRSLEVAKKNYTHINFENRNMFDTKYEDATIDGIVCFYGIVHFTYKEIDLTIKEWKRILKSSGKALFSFHVGEDTSIRVEKFLEKDNANATWNYFRIDEIIKIIENNGLGYDEVLLRYPYIGSEYPSKRCYVQFTKK